MHTNTIACLLTFALLAGATSVSAADATKAEKFQSQLQARFKAADANGDGKLSKEEAKGHMPLVYRHYSEIDTAGTGAITPEQLKAFAAKAM